MSTKTYEQLQAVKLEVDTRLDEMWIDPDNIDGLTVAGSSFDGDTMTLRFTSGHYTLIKVYIEDQAPTFHPRIGREYWDRGILANVGMITEQEFLDLVAFEDMDREQQREAQDLKEYARLKAKFEGEQA